VNDLLVGEISVFPAIFIYGA